MRQTHENVYHLKKGKKIPVKWMAPEALYNSEYTTKSDVYVLLFFNLESYT